MNGSAGNMALKRALIYCGITFGITWTIWITAGVLTGTYSGNLENLPLMTGIIALGMFVPLIGALLTNVILGKQNRIDLAFRPRIKGNVRAYLAAWFMPAVVSLAGAIVFFLVMPDVFSPLAQPFAEALQPAIDAGQLDAGMIPLLIGVQIAFALILAPFINMIPAFGEEAGWRGMLFPSLSERFGVRGSALIVGVIWGIWHAPATCMGHNYGMNYVGFPIVGILTMIVFCTSVSCCLSWLRLRTKSVWPCALAHGALNAIAGVSLYFCTAGVSLLGPSPTGLLAGIPLAALALWCWIALPKAADAK